MPTDDYSTYPSAEPTTAEYAEMDAPVRQLVKVLNGLPGVRTLSSCGGHENPLTPDSLPPEEWCVTIALEPADLRADVHAPSPDGWLDLEFLTYMVNRSPPLRTRAVEIVADAKPPHLNFPGRMVAFNVQGWRDGEGGIEPDEVAAEIERGLRELYFPSA